jgi:DHA2 family multidrug resistance protein
LPHSTAANLTARGSALSDPIAPNFLVGEVSRQATMLGFIDAFYFIAISFVVLAPLVFLLGEGNGKAPAE